MGRREGLLGDEADLVDWKAVDETRGVDIPPPHHQVRHLRGAASPRGTKTPTQALAQED